MESNASTTSQTSAKTNKKHVQLEQPAKVVEPEPNTASYIVNQAMQRPSGP